MKSRRNFLKESAMAATALAIGNPLQLFAGEYHEGVSNGGFRGKLTILHTNDLHNQIYSSFHEGKFSGGFRHTAQLLSGIKNNEAHTLLLDAGDIFNGNPNDNAYQSKTLHLMENLGYDAVVLGNRDYETGLDCLQYHWTKTNITLVNSTTNFKNTWLRTSQEPYKIVNKAGIKIGIIATTINMQNLVPSLYNEVHYKDTIATLNSLAYYLKEVKKCSLVICLSHLGFRNKNKIDDVKLAAHSENIDVIIGGHSHTFMSTPYIVLNKQNTEVVINHAGCKGIQIGSMSFEFDGDGYKTNVKFLNTLVKN